MADQVPSPCIGVCKYDRGIGFCRGCGRTLEEIAAWTSNTAETQAAIRVAAEKRLRENAEGPRRYLSYIPLLLLPLIGCYLHHFSIPKDDFWRNRWHLKAHRAPPLEVDFQRIDPGEYFRATFHESEVSSELRKHNVVRIEPASNLMLRIESQTGDVPGIGNKPYDQHPACVAATCLTLFVFPVIQVQEHKANFILFDKTSREVLAKETITVRDRMFFGWLMIPGALLGRLSDNIYSGEEYRMRQYAVERFVARLSRRLGEEPALAIRLRETAAMRAGPVRVRIEYAESRPGANMPPELESALRSALARRGVEMSEDGIIVRVTVHGSLQVGTLGRSRRLEMTASVGGEGGPPPVRFQAAASWEKVSEKLAATVKNMLFTPRIPERAPKGPARSPRG